MRRLIKEIEDMTVVITFTEADEYDTARKALSINDEVTVFESKEAVVQPVGQTSIEKMWR